MSQLSVRPEHRSDREAIHAVHVAAFPTDAEARLVDLLRLAGQATLSLVAERDGEVVGHVMFSPVTLAGHSSGLGLGPVAVQPTLHRHGIGSRLVRAGLELARSAGQQYCVVLGDPAYYHRFGFARARPLGLDNEYGADDAFMALELQSGALSGHRGTVRYAPAFAQVG